MQVKEASNKYHMDFWELPIIRIKAMYSVWLSVISLHMQSDRQTELLPYKALRELLIW